MLEPRISKRNGEKNRRIKKKKSVNVKIPKCNEFPR